MKLRLKGNTLRLRLNQTEVKKLSEGAILQEVTSFPAGAQLTYTLSPAANASASFTGSVVSIEVPVNTVSEWALGDDIGIYLDFAANPEPLKIAIEKDLECVDAPPEERELGAFPRLVGKNC